MTCLNQQQQISKGEAILECADISVVSKVNQCRSKSPHMSTSIISALDIATTELEMSHMVQAAGVCVFVCLVNTVKLPVCSSDFSPLG